MDEPVLDSSKVKTIEMAGGEEAPLGYALPASIRLSRSLAMWSKEPSNKKTWKEIMRESKGKITVNPFDDGGVVVSKGDFAFYTIGQASVAELRRFGFNGFVDTMESVFEMYQEMAQLGVIPAPVVDAARPMI